MSQSGTYNKQSGGGTGNVQFILADNAVDVPPNPITNAITLHGGTGVTTVGNAGAYTVTINAGGGGFVWVEATALVVNMEVNKGYVCHCVTEVIFILPVTAAFGDVIRVVGESINGWAVNLNAGQFITMGSSTTSAGPDGQIASTDPLDCVELLCTDADTTFEIISSIGNITFI